jgi:hypothetical protein
MISACLHTLVKIRPYCGAELDWCSVFIASSIIVLESSKGEDVGYVRLCVGGMFDILTFIL